MRLPEYTPRLRRRLTLALIPLRAIGCAAALWTCWLQYRSLDDLPTEGNPVSIGALAVVSGLLVGFYIILGLGLAVVAWHPLPPTQSRPTRR